MMLDGRASECASTPLGARRIELGLSSVVDKTSRPLLEARVRLILQQIVDCWGSRPEMKRRTHVSLGGCQCCYQPEERARTCPPTKRQACLEGRVWGGQASEEGHGLIRQWRETQWRPYVSPLPHPRAYLTAPASPLTISTTD